MFGWKKKKKENKNTSSPSGGFSSSLNNLLKGSPKAKKANKHGKTDILSGSQTSGSNSPHSVTDRAHLTNTPTSFISNGSASPSPSNNSSQITSQFVQSLPPPEYSLRVPPDHSRLTPKTSNSDHPSLRATYTPPPGYGILKQVGRPGSSASELSNASRLTSPSAEGVDADFDVTGESNNVSKSANRSTHPCKPLEDWSEAEILQWLNDSDLEYFADIFQGCDIDGDYISQVTEEDLIDLEVEEGSLREQLLREITNLKQELAHESNAQQAEHNGEEEEESSSVHFGDTSDEDLFPDLPTSPSLSALKSGSKPSMTSSVKGNITERQEGKEDGKKKMKEKEPRKRQDSDLSSILSGSSVKSSGSGSGSHGGQSSDDRGSKINSSFEASPEHAIPKSSIPFSKKRVSQWTERDIIHWLDSINLGHLAQNFIDHDISGKELMEIDMSLLDEMDIDSSIEREKILSTLYELTNPSSTTARDDVLSVISHTSGYEKQKYMAAVSVLQSDDPEDIQLLPPEERDSLLSSPEKNDSREENKRMKDEWDDDDDWDDEEDTEEKVDKKVAGKMDASDDETDDSDGDWDDEDDTEKKIDKKKVTGTMDAADDETDDSDGDWDDEDDEEEEEVVELLAEIKETERKAKLAANQASKDAEKNIPSSKTADKDSKESEASDFDFDNDDEEEVKFMNKKQSNEALKSAMIVNNISGNVKSVENNASKNTANSAKVLKQGSVEKDNILKGSSKEPVTRKTSVDKKDLSRTTSSDSLGAVIPANVSVDGTEHGAKKDSTKGRKVETEIPVEEESPRRGDVKPTRSESSRSSGSEKEEKKKKGGLFKLKEVISPSNWKKSPRDSNTIHVWTDVGQTGSGSKTLVVKLTEESTTQDLINLCLNQLDLIEDPRLYRVLQATIHGKDKGNDVELVPMDCPLVIQHGWSDHSSNRFEFRQKTAQGGAIKTVLRIPGQPPKGKLVSISLSTPAIEVVILALKKFDMKNVDPTLFCLLEVDKDGDVCDVDDEALPLQLDSHAFVLCDRSNRDLHWTTQEEEEANAGDRKVKRQDSLTSRASSKMSAISLGSSYGSSEVLCSSRIDNEKLSKLEKEMASIEESLVPGKDTSTPSAAPAPTQVKVKDISPIPEIHINDVEEDNSSEKDISRELEEKSRQLAALQEALADLGNSYHQMNVDARLQTLEQRLASCPETESLPERLLELLAELESASQEMEDRQRDLDEIKQSVEELGASMDDSTSSMYEVTLAEVALLKAQYDHSTLLANMEIAIADYQLQAAKIEEAKKKAAISPRGALNFYNTLPHNQQFSVFALLASASSQGFHFQVAEKNSQSGVYIQSCRSADVLRVGDRVIEVNGHSTLGSSVLEVNTLLNRSKKAQLVCMRAGRDQVSMEVDRLTRQLATASEHYESCWQENKRLTDIVHRLRPLEHQVLELNQQKVTMQQLHHKIETLESRNQEISEELRMAHEGNINQSNHAISRLQGDKERLETRVRQQEQKLKKLEAELAQKNSETSSIVKERDDALSRLKSIDLNRNEEVKADDLIASANNDAPLWEVLKPANKDEILHVLQDELEEAGRQKQYLDQLYTLMLERAPELLEHLEQDFEGSELSGSEEFC
ncbi:titin homolog isoform X1 [Lytechinus variegatus]|uniref:titin homolog isoform X1 n=1 Tax=Lytechinus variegatus TaxID=7654 RepID=UPI001BB1B0C6|nr:titin homolog isoform X1 [Lytechinus variegatus]